MSNIIITDERNDEENIPNQFCKNSAIEENSISEQKIHSLFTKPLAHAVGAGINPLVDSAAYIFDWMGKLSQISSPPNLLKLNIELLEGIHEFRSALTALNYMPRYLSEFVPIATYVLCLTLDDIIAHTVWAQNGKWDKYRLLNSYNLHSLRSSDNKSELKITYHY